MTDRRRGRWAAVLAVVGVALAGCATGAPPAGGFAPPRPFIGVLRVVAGSSVFLNGRAVGSGTSVFGGDRVSTGAGSRVLLDLAGGGTVQLDQNTDPEFEFLREGACVLIRALNVGQLLAEAEKTICLDTAAGLWQLGSTVNWQVADGRATLTVIDGTLRMLRPSPRLLRAGQQVTIVGGALGPVVTLSGPELRAVTMWLAPPGRPPRIEPPPAPPPAPATVPDLRGTPIDDARRTLREGALSVGQVSEEYTGQARAGTVVRQNPPAGAAASPGTAVDLWVEVTPEVVTPDVARIIVNVLNDVTNRLNRALSDLNAERYAAATTGIGEASRTFQRVERPFAKADVSGGPLERLYELATAGRDLQRRMLDLAQAALSQRQRGEIAAYRKSVSEFNRLTGRFNATIGEINQVLGPRQ